MIYQLTDKKSANVIDLVLRLSIGHCKLQAIHWVVLVCLYYGIESNLRCICNINKIRFIHLTVNWQDHKSFHIGLSYSCSDILYVGMHVSGRTC